MQLNCTLSRRASTDFSDRLQAPSIFPCSIIFQSIDRSKSSLSWVAQPPNTLTKTSKSARSMAQAVTPITAPRTIRNNASRDTNGRDIVGGVSASGSILHA